MSWTGQQGGTIRDRRDRVAPPASELASTTNALLDVNEVAELLGVTVRFVRRLVAERRIPFYKVGKFIRFRSTDLADWVDACRIEPHR